MRKQHIYSFLLLIIFFNITTSSISLTVIGDPISDPSKDLTNDPTDKQDEITPIDIFIGCLIISGIIGVPIFLLLATRPINKGKQLQS